jgi:large subunit ribosomal protein L35
MPKMKTHSGAKKRFRKTATGRIRARHAMRTHILGKKARKRLRRLDRPMMLSKADESEAKALLPGNSGRKK